MPTYLDLAAALVKQLEGCKLVGYLDSVGKATDGYGHTGPGVAVGKSITQEIADYNLNVDLSIADQRLQAVTQPIPLAKLDAHQRAALISFVFNVGADESWTIWKDIDAGNLVDIPNQLRRFVNGKINGKEQVIPGLSHRREAEVAFWNTADLTLATAVASTPTTAATGATVPQVTAPSSSVTRDIPTPPTPTPNPPMAKTSLVAKVVTGVAGLGATAAQIHDVVAPHAEESPIFAHLAVFASVVVVGAAMIGIVIHANQQTARST